MAELASVCPGLNLLAALELQKFRAGNPFTIQKCLSIMYMIGLGLADMHAAGVVHRDLKGMNVLVTAVDGKVVVKVSGIARVCIQQSTVVCWQSVASYFY